MNLDVKAAAVTVHAEDSSVARLRGSAGGLIVTAGDRSRFEGEELVAETVIAKAVNSSQIFVYADKTLDVTGINNSYVGFKGSPEVTEHLDASSHINNNDAR